MLSREIMGLLALAILWVNVLLVAAAAGKEIGKLRAKMAALGRVARGKVTRGNADGAVAELRIDQIGRFGVETARERSILFADRSWTGESFGGAVALDEGGEIEIDAGAAEVWLEPSEITAAAACSSRAEFDAAYADARKAKGWPRVIRARVLEGARVFVARATNDGVAIGTIDPIAWCNKKIGLAVAFIVLELAAAGACTSLALSTPRFGTLSTIGGALCLAYFLLVQPAGTALRDAVRFPSQPITRGAWRSERAGADEVAERAT